MLKSLKLDVAEPKKTQFEVNLDINDFYDNMYQLLCTSAILLDVYYKDSIIGRGMMFISHSDKTGKYAL